MQTRNRTQIGGALLGTAALCVGLAHDLQAATTGWWRFETGGGVAVTNGQALATVDDSSGNGWTGTPIGTGDRYISTPFASTLATGQANHFALSNAISPSGQGVMLNAGKNPGPIDSTFTIEASIRLTSYQPFNRGIFRSRDASGGFNLGFGLVNDTNGNADELQIGLYALSAVVTDTNDILALNANYDVAATYDGATLKLYLNGILVGSKAAIGYAGSSFADAIGNDPAFPNAAADFPGIIDEVRVSNVALAPNQFLIPEPATLGLVAVGGVLLIRRCRERQERK